jgi:hypothetical protein
MPLSLLITSLRGGGHYIFSKFIPFLLFIISHYPVSYILREKIPPGEYSLSADTSV